MPDIFDPTAMSIIQDTNFDPMAILKGDQKIDSGTPIVNMKTAGANNPDPDPEPKKNPTPSTLDISDALIMSGLKKAKGIDDGDGDGDGDNPDSKKSGKSLPDDKTNAFNIHYNLMVESGEWDEIEGFDGSESKYIEARNINEQRRAMGITEDWFKEAFEKNPEGVEMGKALFNHLRNGGRIADFVDMMAPAEFDFNNIHSDDDSIAEDASKELIKQYYSSIGWKADKINSRINNLVKLGQVVDEAKQIEDPYKDLIQNRIAAEQKRAETLNAARQKAGTELTNALKTKIDDNHAFGDVKLWSDKKDKQSLQEFIFVSDPETNRTAFTDELNKGMKDPDFLLFAAAALKNQWHKKGIVGLGDGGKTAVDTATKNIKTQLEGALLNKQFSTKDSLDDQKSSSSQREKFVFDLEKAVVIS